MEKWFLYIVKCSDNSLYTGITTDITRRIDEHNSGSRKSSKYTRRRLPVTLVYSETLNSKSEALKRELAIKDLSRNDKLALIDKS